jgi:hypothetical protein
MIRYIDDPLAPLAWEDGTHTEFGVTAATMETTGSTVLGFRVDPLWAE